MSLSQKAVDRLGPSQLRCGATLFSTAVKREDPPQTNQPPPDDHFGGRYDDFPRWQYELIHESLVELEHELAAWNRRTVEAGAQAPYEAELKKLRQMIRFGGERLQPARESESYYVEIGQVSIGSIRIWVAGLLYKAHHERLELEQRRTESWPPKVVQSIASRVENIEKLANRFKLPPAAVLKELLPAGRLAPQNQWDVFISHASEDKDAVAQPLAELLRERGLEVWYDDFSLTIGDSLRRSIDRGLRLSRFAVVVLSPHFFAKEWPRKELDGLYALESEGRELILPVWHQVTAAEVGTFSPTLRDRVGLSTTKGLPAIADEIAEKIARGPREAR